MFAGATKMRSNLMNPRTFFMISALMLSAPVAAQDAAGEMRGDSAPSGRTQETAAGEIPEGTAAGGMLQDVAAGQAIYEETCRNCHGPKAQGMASFPKLAGEDAAHLVMRLEQYKSGDTVGPNSALMIPIASDLSHQDIVNVAAYISTTFE